MVELDSHLRLNTSSKLVAEMKSLMPNINGRSPKFASTDPQRPSKCMYGLIAVDSEADAMGTNPMNPLVNTSKW